jgi:hypothetical protein
LLPNEISLQYSLSSAYLYTYYWLRRELVQIAKNDSCNGIFTSINFGVLGEVTGSNPIAMEKIKIKQEREEGRIPVREEFGDITIVADCYPLC